MTKHQISLYVEEGRNLIRRLRNKGIVPSHLIESLLIHEDKYSQEGIIETKEELIDHLKLKISKLSLENETCHKNNIILEKELKEIKEKYAHLEERSTYKIVDD